MVAYARARTKSWLSMIWPETVQRVDSASVELKKSKELMEKQAEQKIHFLEATKNGGMWFS